MDIGLICSCLGLKGGKSWEKTFTRHSSEVCKAIMKVVDRTIDDNLKEEIDLTIKELLKNKKARVRLPFSLKNITIRLKQELMKLTTYASLSLLTWAGIIRNRTYLQ